MTDARTADERLAATAKALGDVCVYPWNEHGIPGMTLRQLYAAMAMQGILAGDDGASAAKYVAQEAVSQADALLTELAK